MKWSKLEENSVNSVKNFQKKGWCRMVNFVGKYPRQLDDRGRFILPAKIREKLSGTVYITQSPVDDCLNLYTEEEWEDIAEKVRALPTVTDRNAAALQRTLFGNAISCDLDKQGRIPLNQEHIDFAKMKKDIMLVGVNAKLEIWDSEEWKKASEAIDADAIIEGIAKYEINI